MFRIRLLCAVLATIAAASFLTACSDDDKAKAAALTVSDQWVKAAPSGMTAMFGTLKNDGDSEIRIVSGTSDVAGKVELHEMVDEGGQRIMREKTGGFAIPAHGTVKLAPGGEHIMLMDLKKPIVAGETVVVTLRLADGSTHKVSGVARDFAGNEENYQP
ncbi:copper chaperone PCu(A)C [Gordonia sp. PP30]|nr:copper chaperone PCu(A)C [Gordonia sp. PP30]UQE75961.1 copper chaperone PCu(A)C [Gordonia sp. PP30]